MQMSERDKRYVQFSSINFGLTIARTITAAPYIETLLLQGHHNKFLLYCVHIEKTTTQEFQYVYLSENYSYLCDENFSLIVTKS